MPNTAGYGYIIPAGATYVPASNPVAPASTSAYKMQGLGFLLTPLTPSGKIISNITATITTTTGTVGTGINLQMWYGPVQSGIAVPANGGAIPASALQLGTTSTFEVGTAITTVGSFFFPIDLMGMATSLTPGQQYWFDLAAESIGTVSAMQLTQVNGILYEVG